MNKTALRSFISDLMNRSDLSTTLTDTYIDLALQKIQRVLRAPFMERSTVFTGASGGSKQFVLLADFLEAISFIRTVSNNTGNLEVSRKVTLAEFHKTALDTSEPVFCRKRDVILMKPYMAEAETAELLYYGELDTFTSDTDETVLSKIAPDLIAYTVSALLCDYFVDERVSIFQARADQIIESINTQVEDETMIGSISIANPYSSMEY